MKTKYQRHLGFVKELILVMFTSKNTKQIR